MSAIQREFMNSLEVPDPVDRGTNAPDHKPFACEVCGKNLFRSLFDVCPGCRNHASNQDYVSGRRYRYAVVVNDEGEEEDRDTTSQELAEKLWGRASSIETCADECLTLRGEGLTTNEIAERLKIKPRTVREHLQSACKTSAIKRLALKGHERDTLIVHAWRERLTEISAGDLEEALRPEGIRIGPGYARICDDREEHEAIGGYFIPQRFIRETGFDGGVPDPVSLAERNRIVRPAIEEMHAREDSRRLIRTDQQRTRKGLPAMDRDFPKDKERSPWKPETLGCKSCALVYRSPAECRRFHARGGKRALKVKP